MEKRFSTRLLRAIRHAQAGKSFYQKAKETGLRPEVVKRLEESFDNDKVDGSAESLCTYVDTFIRIDNEGAFRAFYNLCLAIRQVENNE